MRGLLRSQLGYHAWANRDLFEKLQQLDPDRNAPERHTVIRLINHYHVVARIFSGHLTGAAHGFLSDNTEATPQLDDLAKDVAALDGWYLDYIEKTPPALLGEFVGFTFTDGDKGYMSRAEMISHVVLHAGIHRGEVARILSQLSITPPWDTFAVFLHGTQPQRRLQGI
ncbi:DinB family protein [Agrobacterium fabrum]|uniref:DinB family protein n=1 Tax=Agrobacterium fabrum TaxID=1176649 RepID=UPI003BA2BEAB